MSTIAVQGDGKILIGGPFNKFDSVPRNRLARLNSNGSLDTTFSNSVSSVLAMSLAEQNDGGVLVSGSFRYRVGSSYRYNLMRLNADGSVDTNFVATSDADAASSVDWMALQPDGRIVLAGGFSKIDGVLRQGLARVMGDGSLDTSFDPGTGVGIYSTNWSSGGTNFTIIYGGVNALVLQRDGKAVIGGEFINLNGIPRLSVARVDTNGALDAVYDPGPLLGFTNTATGSSGHVAAMSLDSSNRIALAYRVSPEPATYVIARLNENGTVDNSFVQSYLTNGTVYGLVAQSDGRIVIAGTFTNVQGTARNKVARPNSDGTLDLTFVCDPGPNDAIYAITCAANQDVLIAGRFTAVGATPAGGIARLLGSPGLRLMSSGFVDGAFQSSIWTATGKSYFLESREVPSGTTWAPVSDVSGDGTLKNLTDTNASAGQKFYRVRVE